jgi:hypothetical protein
VVSFDFQSYYLAGLMPIALVAGLLVALLVVRRGMR